MAGYNNLNPTNNTDPNARLYAQIAEMNARLVRLEAGGSEFKPWFAVVGLQGGWSKSWTPSFPAEMDIVVIYMASAYATSAGMNGTRLLMDGSALQYWGDYYFNETGSHKQTGGGGIRSACAAGNHTFTVENAYGSTGSDTNDRASIYIIGSPTGA